MTRKKPKIMLPFIHYRPELPEILQAVLMVAVGFSTVPVLQETLGMPYGVALTAVAIAEFLGLLHVTFGDPVVPGWIASALPLVLTYMGGYAVGIDSVYALIALQIILSVLFIVLGATGLAHKLMKIFPGSVKAGILLGAGVAALKRVVGDGGYLSAYPISVSIGCVITFVVLFSNRFKILKGRSRLISVLGKYGMLPGLLAAMAAGFISGELPLPVIQWGLIPFSFGELFKGYSVFSIGLPSVSTFLAAAPTAVAIYIIAFGEIVTAEAVLKDAENSRPNEPINFNSNKTNIIAGVRNLILALFAPFTALAGPLWSAVSVSIGERYKEGKKAMQSIYSGCGSFKLATALCILLLPVATLLDPVLPVALAITLAVQGFACSYIAIEQVKNDRTAAGVAGVTGAVVFLAGLNWALVAGFVMYFLLEGGKSRKTDENIVINERSDTMGIQKSDLIIAIDSELYSQGEAIAKELSGILGAPCYCSEILTEASKLSGISEKILSRYDGRPLRAAYDLQAEDEAGIMLPSVKELNTCQMLAAKNLAGKGSCILVDRHSVASLAGNPNCISVFIHASFDSRARALAEGQSIELSKARALLRRADRLRKASCRAVSRQWGEADSYILCVDSTGIDAHAMAMHLLRFIESISGEQLASGAPAAKLGA